MTNRIYVACLASYNNGVLHGEWIDASVDADEMQEKVNAILRSSRFPNVTRKYTDREAIGKAEALGADIYANTSNGKFNVSGTSKIETFSRADAAFEFLGMKGLPTEAPSAEEFAIHDFEGEALQGLGEYCGLQAVASRVKLEEKAENALRLELGSDGLEIVLAYWDNRGFSYMPSDADEAIDQARDAYCGSFSTWTEWAENYVDDSGMLSDIPENIRSYFDYDAYGRDARLNGDIFESKGHFFYSH